MKILRGVVMVMIVGCFSLSHALLAPTSKTILITSDTVQYYASFIDSSATILDLTINFEPGGSIGEELLRVPIAAPGELHPQAKIRITVGMNPPPIDNDPRVGITDGVNRNQYSLVDDASSTTKIVNPCKNYGSGSYNGRSGPHGNIVAGTYVMIFDPIHNFGSCSTNNGFSTNVRFGYHVDLSKGLSLVVHRDDSNEKYTFHYFLVEFL